MAKKYHVEVRLRLTQNAGPMLKRFLANKTILVEVEAVSDVDAIMQATRNPRWSHYYHVVGASPVAIPS